MRRRGYLLDKNVEARGSPGDSPKGKTYSFPTVGDIRVFGFKVARSHRNDSGIADSQYL